LSIPIIFLTLLHPDLFFPVKTLTKKPYFCTKSRFMKKALLLLPVALIIASGCGNTREEAGNGTASADTSLLYFGDSITQEGAIPAEQLTEKMAGADTLRVKLSGKIEEVCQKKGCWMTMSLGGDKTMQVRFKDYGFFVPKDASGKNVIIEGLAFNDTTSVAELQHYAEDAGKPKEEIEKITTPELAISFEANGLIIKK
jgi:hypothetical protein